MTSEGKRLGSILLLITLQSTIKSDVNIDSARTFLCLDLDHQRADASTILLQRIGAPYEIGFKYRFQPRIETDILPSLKKKEQTDRHCGVKRCGWCFVSHASLPFFSSFLGTGNIVGRVWAVLFTVLSIGAYR